MKKRSDTWADRAVMEPTQYIQLSDSENEGKTEALLLGAQKSTKLDQLFLPGDAGIAAFFYLPRPMEEIGLRARDVLRKPLRLLQMTNRAVGVLPYRFCESRGKYEMAWKSVPCAHTLLTGVYMTALILTAATGIARRIMANDFFGGGPEVRNVQGIKLMGIILVGGNLFNAWFQVFFVLYVSPRYCSLLNSWNVLAEASALDPTAGVRAAVYKLVGFLAVFWLVVFLMTVAGEPKIVSHVLDGVAETLLLVPPSWLARAAPTAKVVRLLVCFVCLHIFGIFKGSLFSFTTNCHMLKNGFAAWNKQLATGLEDIWRRQDKTRGRLGHLVQSHCHLVSLVRETEAIFGPMLQCYYASTVVILCTELYLLAYRIGSKDYSVDSVVTTGLLTLQTAAVFVQVSLAAGAVEEVANDSVDVLRRGLPYNTSERDRFNRDELVTALTGSQISITGGKFFVINRPFIITVISAVVTYFIVMIQFMQPGLEAVHEQPLAGGLNITVDNATTLDSLADSLL
ncbi:uncharacterized protein LOC125027565 [Penaeus chinensis]|uniref:uncharacterized protein LOC125027565 n=1 Tax=Penaeus chinensis TaxID=139456 RepID=UPI001FB7293B|nr:uncharacterized protein LOC125027565 [Penaeus chinensis]